MEKTIKRFLEIVNKAKKMQKYSLANIIFASMIFVLAYSRKPKSIIIILESNSNSLADYKYKRVYSNDFFYDLLVIRLTEKGSYTDACIPVPLVEWRLLKKILNKASEEIDKREHNREFTKENILTDEEIAFVSETCFPKKESSEYLKNVISLEGFNYDCDRNEYAKLFNAFAEYEAIPLIEPTIV